MKNKKKNKIEQEGFTKERIHKSIIIVVLSIWIYIVISNYYKHNVFNFPIISNYFSLEGYSSGFNLLYVLSHFSSIFFALLIFLSAYGIGSKIIEIFNLEVKTFSFTEKLLFSISFGFGTLFVLLFVIGILGILYKPVVLTMVIIFDFLGVYQLVKNRKEIVEFELPKFNFLEKLLIGLCLTISFVVLIGCLSPEIFYDSLVYHLAKPNHWIQYHKIVPNKTMVVADFYPGNVNLLFVIGLFFKDETVCKMVSLIFCILTCLILYSAGKRFINYKVGFLSAIFFFSIPYTGILAYRSAVEMPIAFFETLMIFSFILWILSEKNEWLIISALNCGFSIGIKYTSFYALVSISVAIIIKSFIEKKSFLTTLKLLFLFVCISIAVALPWFLYNFSYTGNPLYPYFSKFIGFYKQRSTHDPTSSMYKFSQWGKDFVNLIKSPWIVSMGLYEEAFIGVLLLLLIPLFVFYKSNWKPTKYLFVYILLYMIIWDINHKLYVRYFVPALATVSFLCAFYFNEAKLGGFKNICLLVITVIVINNLLFVMTVQKFSNNCFGVVCGAQSKKEYLNCMRPTYPNPYYSVADWINKNLPEDVMVYMCHEYRSYYIQRKVVMTDFSSWSPLALWCNKAKDEDDLYTIFKKEGVTHILLNLPEGKRLAGFDDLYFEKRGFEIWLKFWDKYVEEVYKDIADISLPDRGIYSMKNQVPQWWQGYSSDPKNYVYLYKILSEEEIKLIKEGKREHKKPINFFLLRELYSSSRWEILKDVAEKYLTH